LFKTNGAPVAVRRLIRHSEHLFRNRSGASSGAPAKG